MMFLIIFTIISANKKKPPEDFKSIHQVQQEEHAKTDTMDTISETKNKEKPVKEEEDSLNKTLVRGVARGGAVIFVIIVLLVVAMYGLRRKFIQYK